MATINKSTLEAISRAFNVSSKDFTRYSICGVRIEAPSSGKVRVVATNGHSLTRYYASADGVQFSGDLFIHNDNAKAVKAILKDWKKMPESMSAELEFLGDKKGYALTVGCSRVLFQFDNTDCGTYPDYNQVIPNPGNFEIALDASLLMSLVEGMTSGKPIVKLNFSGNKSPIRVSVLHDENALGVIMPCRADLVWNKPFEESIESEKTA
jgi:DNA polymerase III sliding clamp (beta) subunit (PCNA family)